MQMFVEVWCRRTPNAAYRRHGFEQVAALLEAGMPMMLTVDGSERRVTVDKAERIAAGMPAAGYGSPRPEMRTNSRRSVCSAGIEEASLEPASIRIAIRN